VTGIALLVLFIFWLNRWGIPVQNFGPALAMGLLMVSVIILILKKPIVPIRKYAPFCLIFLAALWLTGRPLLEYGFDWVSYCNDDMANYCLAASRFLYHGFYDTPSAAQMNFTDFSQYYWFEHVIDAARPGAELTLAWVSSLAHLTP